MKLIWTRLDFADTLQVMINLFSVTPPTPPVVITIPQAFYSEIKSHLFNKS